MTALIDQPRHRLGERTRGRRRDVASAAPAPGAAGRRLLPGRARVVAGAVGAAVVTGLVMGLATSVAGRWS